MPSTPTAVHGASTHHNASKAATVFIVCVCVCFLNSKPSGASPVRRVWHWSSHVLGSGWCSLQVQGNAEHGTDERRADKTDKLSQARSQPH